MTTSGFCFCNGNPKCSFVCGLDTAKNLSFSSCCFFCVSISSCRLVPELRLHIHTLSVVPLNPFLFVLSWPFHTNITPFVPPLPFSFFHPGSRYLYADPLHCNMTYLFLRLLKDDLREYTYAARLAGLVYGIASGMNAILVSTVISPSLFGEMGGVLGEGWSLQLFSVPVACLFFCFLQSDGMFYLQHICLICLLG